MSGRRLAPVWQYFNRDCENKNNVKAICRGCKTSLQGIVVRMEKHAKICKDLKQMNGSEESLSTSITASRSTPVKRKQCELDIDIDSCTPNKKQRQSCIDSNIVKTSEAFQYQLDLQLCRAIASSNAPFVFVENKEFRKYCDMLRPGASVPNRHRIGGDLLDTVYQQQLDKVKSTTAGSIATLAIDGWSSITNDPVIGVSFTCKGKSYMIDTIDTSGEPHTTEYLTDLSVKAIEKAESSFGVKIGSFVTDGAANMVSMRKKLLEESEGKVVAYGCQAHLLNLLAKDLHKMQKSNTEHIICVLKYFRNVHSAQSRLKQLHINRPPLPAETRWNTVRDSLLYYDKNWPQLVQIAKDLLPRTSVERRYMENVQITNAASELLQIHDVFAAALNRLQSDTATIADAVETWLDILENLKQINNPKVLELAKERSKQPLQDATFLAANLLDHRYNGARLTGKQVKEATDFITQLSPDSKSALTKFLAKSDPYDCNCLSADESPTTWWSAGLRLGFDSNLCTVASQLTSAVANSGGLERQFSTLKLTYGSLRTNLGIEKAGKLTFIYRSINSQH
jgi:hypothetical protein